jgi:hypothetical protein
MKTFIPPLLIVLMFSAGATNAGQPGLPSLQTLMNQANQLHKQQGSQRSLEWLLLAERDDRYNDTTSSWVYVDSIYYGYGPNGAADTLIELANNSGTWQNYIDLFISFDANGNEYYAIEHMWNTGNDTWGNYAQAHATYDGHHNQLTDTTQIWVNYLGTWRNNTNEVYTYDGSNNNLTDIKLVWDTVGNAWVNTTQVVYTYDASNNRTSTTNEAWNTGLNSWTLGTRVLFTFDGNRNVLSQVDQYADGNNWENQDQFLNSYSGNNDTESIYQLWDSASATWNSSNRYDYIFDGNNNVITEQDYFFESGSWVNAYLTQNVYVDVNKRSTRLMQEWASSMWVNYYKFQYSYDGLFNETHFTDYYWNTGASAWDGNADSSYTYDANNNQIYGLYKKYNTNNLTFENSTEFYKYYEQLDVQAIDEAKNQINVALYPNPSTGNDITLTANVDQDAKVRIGLYDMQGKLITTQLKQFTAGANTMQLNYPNISAGNYYVQVLEYTCGKSSVLKLTKF